MEALNAMYPQVDARGLDSFSYAYPRIQKVVGRTYLELLKRTPKLWGYLYDNRNVLEATVEIREVLSRLNSGKFRKIITGFAPHAVVCTQAAPCAVLSNLKRKQPWLKLVGIITDYKAHAYWAYNNVDLYIVPTQEVREDLLKYGIKRDRIKVLGIPIDPKFQVRGSKIRIRQQLKLNPNLTTILVMGGGQGFGPIGDILGELSKVKPPFQTIIVTGKNKKLYRSLKKINGTFSFPVKLMSFTRRIEEIMDAADIIITKPGGLTSSEALAKGLPIIIVDPIPGQEERNSQFLVKEKVALRIDDINDISKVISNLLNSPAKMNQMSLRAVGLSKPRAAIDAAQVIMKLLHYDTMK
jgi:processive 1,2-diacylglycerol beta-glucosyltransferase